MEISTNTQTISLNLFLALLFSLTPSLTNAETIDGYTFKGYVKINLNTTELGNFYAENGFYVNPRDIIGLSLKHSEGSQNRAWLNNDSKEQASQELSISLENVTLRVGISFKEISDKTFKALFVVRRDIKGSKEKSRNIIKHKLSGRLDQVSSYRFSDKDSHQLNVEIQIYKQEDQVSELTGNYSLN